MQFPKIGVPPPRTPIGSASTSSPDHSGGQNQTRSSSMNARGMLGNLMPFAAKGTIGEMQNTAAATFEMGPGASPALIDAAHNDPEAKALRQQPITAESTTALCNYEKKKADASDQSIPQNAMAAHPIADLARRGAAHSAGVNTSLAREGVVKTFAKGWNVIDDVIGTGGVGG